MLLDDYYKDQAGSILVSRRQASHFAKKIAGDFNPIHNENAKRFCVPGDLLFALVLNKYGVSQTMNFTFEGMVGDGIPLNFPEAPAAAFDITDVNGKKYLSVERQGEVSANAALIDGLTRSYVAFSGKTFPHILVPLMQQHRMMINPDRPLVIYESMNIALDRLDIDAPELELTGSNLAIDGKRGHVTLTFRLTSHGETIGQGRKSMVLSGLREYDQTSIDQLVSNYDASKQTFQG